MKKIKIVNRKIEELIGAEYNPRFMSEKDSQALEESLKKFDITEPQ